MIKKRSCILAVVIGLAFILLTGSYAEEEKDIKAPVSGQSGEAGAGIQPMALYVIDIGTVSGDGVGYTYKDQVLTFNNGANAHTYTLAGNGTAVQNRIVVNADVKLNINLNNVEMIHQSHSPFMLEDGAAVTMTLSGDNSIICAAGAENTNVRNIAGIQVPENSSLTINGTGTLKAEGGNRQHLSYGENEDDEEGEEYIVQGGAGIGGGLQMNSGAVTIGGSVSIEAQGGGTKTTGLAGTVFGGAGIGGGGSSNQTEPLGSATYIRICDQARVTANGGGYNTARVQSGRGGAGIGSGAGNAKTENGEDIGNSSGTIIIEDFAVVAATGGGQVTDSENGAWGGAGIGGGGHFGRGEEIIIRGNAEVRAYGGGTASQGSADNNASARGGAGIGGGNSGKAVSIIIEGEATVEAVGGGTKEQSTAGLCYGAAGIGSGSRADHGTGSIIIKGNTDVSAKGGGQVQADFSRNGLYGGAGIGGGGHNSETGAGGVIQILESAAVYAEGGGDKIVGSTETVVCGGAGIGGGSNSKDGGEITISGTAVAVEAVGGGTSIGPGSNRARGGAGIGGGGNNVTTGSAGGDIYIGGGADVTATGGGTSEAHDGWGGAGIGGGTSYGDGGSITIEGSPQITSFGGGSSSSGTAFGGAGIGGGYIGKGGDLIITSGTIYARSGGNSEDGESRGACGIGWGHSSAKTYQTANVQIGAAARIEAYSRKYAFNSNYFPAIGATAMNGSGYYLNAYLTTGPVARDADTIIQVYRHRWTVMNAYPGTIVLPADHECFAYTTNGREETMNLEAFDQELKSIDIIVRDDDEQNVKILSETGEIAVQKVKLGYTASFMIEKNLDGPAAAAESFVFRIEYRKTERSEEPDQVYYSTITVEKNQFQGTADLKDLKPGTYLVTELPSNWQYEPDISGGAAAQSDIFSWVENEYISGTFAFKNDRNEKSWINGKDQITNIFAD